MSTKIQLRRGISTDWSTVNPLLSQGELAVELDTYRFKIGDGINNWNSLPYGGIGALTVNSLSSGFSLTGGTTNKTLSVNNSIILAGADGTRHKSDT